MNHLLECGNAACLLSYFVNVITLSALYCPSLHHFLIFQCSLLFCFCFLDVLVKTFPRLQWFLKCNVRYLHQAVCHRGHFLNSVQLSTRADFSTCVQNLKGLGQTSLFHLRQTINKKYPFIHLCSHVFLNLSQRGVSIFVFLKWSSLKCTRELILWIITTIIIQSLKWGTEKQCNLYSGLIRFIWH